MNKNYLTITNNHDIQGNNAPLYQKKGYLLLEICLSIFIMALSFPLLFNYHMNFEKNIYRLNKFIQHTYDYYFLTTLLYSDINETKSYHHSANKLTLITPIETLIYKVKNKHLYRQSLHPKSTLCLSKQLEIKHISIHNHELQLSFINKNHPTFTLPLPTTLH
ncbi:MAG: hypothetical protein VW378_07610 [bacterium]